MLLWEQGVASSNPAAPTINFKKLTIALPQAIGTRQQNKFARLVDLATSFESRACNLETRVQTIGASIARGGKGIGFSHRYSSIVMRVLSVSSKGTGQLFACHPQAIIHSAGASTWMKYRSSALCLHRRLVGSVPRRWPNVATPHRP